jgi:hypothetical protein
MSARRETDGALPDGSPAWLPDAIALYAAGNSAAQVGERVRRSGDTVAEWLVRAGVQMRRPGRRRLADDEATAFLRLPHDYFAFTERVNRSDRGWLDACIARLAQANAEDLAWPDGRLAGRTTAK